VDNPSARQVWEQALEKLRPELGEEAMEMWLKPATPGELKDGRFQLLVPNRFFLDKIASQFQPAIEGALRQVAGQSLVLDCVTQAPGDAPPRPAPRSTPAADYSSSEPELPISDLNPRYAFASFVVGPSNRFAHATAEAISKSPGRQFNPLFLYGGVGLGKTHLLHAIGHGILKDHPKARVLYTTAETFVNEYIDSLRYDKPDAFRSKFRNLDCLLLDDVQFLIGKGRSEEEFFHTFNSLFDLRKQIVISSDRAPRDMSPQEQRLVSRLEWGVVADIKPPDYETRLAILRKKDEEDQLGVPGDVLDFIAKGIKSNIRQLEGSVTRVSAYSRVLKAPLTIDLVKEILKDALSSEQDVAPVRVETVQKVVAEKYSLKVSDLKGHQRTDTIAFPRQLAMYLACELTALSTTEIGKAFSKDHTTVIHGRNKIKDMIARDPFFLETVNKLAELVKSVDNQ